MLISFVTMIVNTKFMLDQTTSLIFFGLCLIQKEALTRDRTSDRGSRA